jgi:predicted peptidase
MKKFLLSTLLMALAFQVVAQHRELYEKQLFIQNEDTLPCRILTPSNFKPGTKYPLVVFLHGMGERGDDNEKQLTWGSEFFLDSLNRTKYPAVVVFPQCPGNAVWATYSHDNTKDSTRMRFYPDSPLTRPSKLLLNFVDTLIAAGTIDPKRIYIGGLSMGGIGTFNILRTRPNLFAAAFAICGGSDPEIVKQFRNNLPVWVFHGANDQTVPVSNSRLVVNTMKKISTKVKYTEYPGVGHDSWKNAFEEKELLPWLFAQRK